MYLVRPTLSRLYLREEHKARKDQDLDTCKWTVGSLRASVNYPDRNAYLIIFVLILS